jgi:chromosomal replication initiation ATPase DnaA
MGKGGRRSNCGKKLMVQTIGPSMEEILQEVCSIFDIPIDKVKTPNRATKIMTCKQIYCLVSCIITNASLKAIGQCINNDHTTVIHHRDTVNDLMSVNDPIFMTDWIEYIGNSKLWNQYQPKQTTLCQE